MAIPLSVLDTFFVQEPTLKRSEPRIDTLHAFCSLDELFDGVRPTEELMEISVPPPCDGVERVFGQLGEFVLEIVLGYGLLDIKCGAGRLYTADSVPESLEVD